MAKLTFNKDNSTLSVVEADGVVWVLKVVSDVISLDKNNGCGNTDGIRIYTPNSFSIYDIDFDLILYCNGTRDNKITVVNFQSLLSYKLHYTLIFHSKNEVLKLKIPFIFTDIESAAHSDDNFTIQQDSETKIVTFISHTCQFFNERIKLRDEKGNVANIKVSLYLDNTPLCIYATEQYEDENGKINFHTIEDVHVMDENNKLTMFCY